MTQPVTTMDQASSSVSVGGSPLLPSLSAKLVSSVILVISNRKVLIFLFFMLKVAVLHLAFIMDDGSLHYMDMDLSVPTFKTANTEDFDGHSNDYMFWLGRNKPSGWREEVEKLDYMSASIDNGAEKFIKIRMINRDTVVPSQVFSGKRQT